MTREEIVEELAEGIFQYSSCIEEIVENTIDFMHNIHEEVVESVIEKVESRSIEPQKTRENFKELGWH